MNLLWTTYGMIQIVSNFVKFAVSIPGQLSLNLLNLTVLSNFDVQHFPPVEKELRNASIKLYQLIDSLGANLSLAIVIIALIILTYLLSLATKKWKFIEA